MAAATQNVSKQTVWSFSAVQPNSFYSSYISGVQRLPNGNTLVCPGAHGHIFEVTEDGDIVWRFFADESCGQCTPCRVGCEKAVALMDNPDWDGALLRDLSQTMMDASICGLGQAAPNPMLMVLKHFPEDIR